MPRISRLFIKTGLLYFLLAVVLRLLLDVSQWFPAFIVLPLFWHALMLGWFTQIILVVSTWMFPGRTKEEGFKAQKLSWFTYLFLNTGLILRFISSPLVALYKQTFWQAVLAASAVLLLLAMVCFVMELWPRILSKQEQVEMRKQKRERRKKRKKEKTS